jgi:bifunctional non-homologous end joining protein LigD
VEWSPRAAGAYIRATREFDRELAGWQQGDVAVAAVNLWLKIKNNHQIEAIICGFTKPRKSRKFFGAIILGKYYGKELKYIGHSGSGFDDKGLADLYEKFESLRTDKCPFNVVPKTNMPVTWLKPKLVCEVKFSEWTDEKILRHPIFAGLREEKNAKDEKNEKVVHPPKKRKKNKSR